MRFCYMVTVTGAVHSRMAKHCDNIIFPGWVNEKGNYIIYSNSPSAPIRIK